MIDAFFNMQENHPLYSQIRKTLIHNARNPDPNSDFDLLTRDYRHLPDDELLHLLKTARYDVLINYDESDFYGYVAYQRKDDEMHVFAARTLDSARGNVRIIMKLTEACLTHAREIKAEKVRIGKGKNKKANQMIKFLQRRQERLGVNVDTEANWIYLLPAPVASVPS